MGLLDSLKSLLSGSEAKVEPGYWVYVRCQRCGEAIRTRLDLRNDLSLQDDGSYVVHKTLIGRSRCFERIDVTLTFDSARQLIGRQAMRGDFITAEEYQVAQQARDTAPPVEESDPVHRPEERETGAG